MEYLFYCKGRNNKTLRKGINAFQGIAKILLQRSVSNNFINFTSVSEDENLYKNFKQIYIYINIYCLCK